MSDEIVAFLHWQERQTLAEQAFAKLAELRKVMEDLEVKTRKFVGPPPPTPPILFSQIDVLGMDVRTVCKLQAIGIQTLGDLICCTSVRLLQEVGLGRTAMFEINRVLKEKGLKLGAKLENWPPAADDVSNES